MASHSRPAAPQTFSGDAVADLFGSSSAHHSMPGRMYASQSSNSAQTVVSARLYTSGGNFMGSTSGGGEGVSSQGICTRACTRVCVRVRVCVYAFVSVFMRQCVCWSEYLCVCVRVVISLRVRDWKALMIFHDNVCVCLRVL